MKTVSPVRRGRLVKTSVRSSRACSERATVCSSKVLMLAPRSWWKCRSLSRDDGSREDCWELREFCGMGQAEEEEVEARWRVWRCGWPWVGPPSSCCKFKSHKLTDRRESSASRRSDEERTVVKERGRRQSGGTISLSAEGSIQEEAEQKLVLQCCALISCLPQACTAETLSQLDLYCEHTLLRRAENAATLTTT